MHLTVLCALLLAMPGQTPTQLMTWGVHNPGLVGFKATLTDLDGGGTDYIARLNVDGYHGQFHARPKRGIVRIEYVSFEDTPDAWHFEQHLAFVRAVIARVYGRAIASDFGHAVRVPLRGRVAAWQGKKLAYATFGAAIFVINTPDFAGVLHNVHQCDALDCSEGD
jgi:hypothetical protein